MLRSLQIERRESPARNRSAHSRMITASLGRTVRWSDSNPKGRVPPPEGRPARALGQLLTIGQLAADRKIVALPVGRDPRVDASPDHSRDINTYWHGPASLRPTLGCR